MNDPGTPAGDPPASPQPSAEHQTEAAESAPATEDEAASPRFKETTDATANQKPLPMSDKTRLQLGALGVALVLGALGDVLLRGTPWGINAPLWIAALLIATFALARWRGVAISPAAGALGLVALAFAGAVAWRDSTTLLLLNVLAAMAAMGLAAFYSRSGRLLLAGVTDYLVATVFVWLCAFIVGMPVALIDLRWREIPMRGTSGQVARILRGLALAVPLLLTFGALFVAADAMFEDLVGNLFFWDLGVAIGHLLLALAIAWIVVGLLYQIFFARMLSGIAVSCPSFLSLGIVELGIVLGTLNVLFLAFVLVQLRYLFGGAALVDASTSLTYSEYARRGFFELVTVAALLLPLLLLADWMRRTATRGQTLLFRALALALVALLFVIMASAMQRMLMYVSVYGLTELRIYTTTFMGWLAVVFGWFLITVLRDQRRYFAFGALVSGIVAVIALNALNPVAMIVYTNAGRVALVPPPTSPAESRRGMKSEFDTAYVTTLGADAVPALVQVLPLLPEAERQATAEWLLTRWSQPKTEDWRTWNWSRWQAWQAVGGGQDALRQADSDSATR